MKNVSTCLIISGSGLDLTRVFLTTTVRMSRRDVVLREHALPEESQQPRARLHRLRPGSAPIGTACLCALQLRSATHNYRACALLHVVLQREAICGVGKGQDMDAVVAGLSSQSWAEGASINVVDSRGGALANVETYEISHNVLRVTEAMGNNTHFNSFKRLAVSQENPRDSDVRSPTPTNAFTANQRQPTPSTTTKRQLQANPRRLHAGTTKCWRYRADPGACIHCLSLAFSLPFLGLSLPFFDLSLPSTALP